MLIDQAVSVAHLTGVVSVSVGDVAGRGCNHFDEAPDAHDPEKTEQDDLSDIKATQAFSR